MSLVTAAIGDLRRIPRRPPANDNVSNNGQDRSRFAENEKTVTAHKRRKGALRRKRHTAPLRRRPARVEVSRAAARCRHRQRPTLAEIAKADLNVACSIRGLGSAASSDGVGVSSCRASSSSGIGNAASSVSRREAIENAVSLVGRWGAASAWLAVVGGGEAAAAAKPSGSIGVATGAGVAAGDGGFGSKAFTEKSYDGFAGGYDDLDGGWAASAIGMEDLRSKLLARAAGCVLEVGVGTGLNLRHYPRNGVTSIDAVDLSPGMLRQASARSASLGMGGLVRLQQMDVEDLKFPSGTFDTVVDTFSLCVFTDPSAALREMARVCKPTGRVLLLENRREHFYRMWRDRQVDVDRSLDVTASYLADKGGAKGCFWNQDVEGLARGAGLRVERSSPALPGGLFRTLEGPEPGPPGTGVTGENYEHQAVPVFCILMQDPPAVLD
eukprot:jgi/Undpi1/5059/HiC_scaffold_19.g08411.m1